jgi:hypothetical protein
MPPKWGADREIQNCPRKNPKAGSGFHRRGKSLRLIGFTA